MRKALVAGNWKMHGRITQNINLIDDLVKQLSPIKESVSVLVCPPLVYLNQVSGLLAEAGIEVGAQDVSRFEKDGAHTGDCSAEMLADIGVSYALVGHSERRSEHQDTDAVIALKLKNLLQVGIKPILCIGESLEQREEGTFEKVIADQISNAFSGLSVEELSNVILAYEPIWAIGTGKTASPDQAQAVHAYIRQMLASDYGSEFSEKVTILYGGSVKAANADQLFSQPDIDGGLIGGAALVSEEFTAICRAAATSPKNG
ncbi:MAG: triose-phosphate isomerase [Oceanospirillales bacterium]|nr:MAG: triose-phosphate isomerase [Oceanospirillales bacterium]